MLRRTHAIALLPRSNFMRTQLYLRYWFDRYKRPRDRKTTASENR
jgi:hypothetical protein